MPTYCCSCSTGVSFCRFRFGVVTPSVLRTPGSGRREDSRWVFDLDRLDAATLFVGTGSLLMLGARAGCTHRSSSRRNGAALLHHIRDSIAGPARWFIDLEGSFQRKETGDGPA